MASRFCTYRRGYGFLGCIVLLLALSAELSPTAGAQEHVRDYVYVGSRVLATIEVAATATPPTPTPTSPPAPQGDLLFVVGASGPAMPPEDLAILERLTALGYNVLPVTGGIATTNHATGKRVVVISNTADAEAVGEKFKAVTTPVMVCKPGLYDDMSMTGAATNADFGGIDGLASLAIVAPGHPLTSGFAGTIVVVDEVSRFGWGAPTTNAIIAARTGNAAAKPAIFAYDRNVVMKFGYAAPGRRLGFFQGDGAAPNLNVYGWALFDSAIAWVVS
jgi:hypothetical protein